MKTYAFVPMGIDDSYNDILNDLYQCSPNSYRSCRVDLLDIHNAYAVESLLSDADVLILKLKYNFSTLALTPTVYPYYILTNKYNLIS